MTPISTSYRAETSNRSFSRTIYRPRFLARNGASWTHRFPVLRVLRTRRAMGAAQHRKRSPVEGSRLLWCQSSAFNRLNNLITPSPTVPRGGNEVLCLGVHIRRGRVPSFALAFLSL